MLHLALRKCVRRPADWVTGQTLYVDGGTNARMGLFWDQGDTPQ